MRHYRPPSWTPALQSAWHDLHHGLATGLPAILTALSQTSGTTVFTWNHRHSFRLNTLFHDCPETSIIPELCIQHWDAYVHTLHALPPSPALAALTLHSYHQHVYTHGTLPTPSVSPQVLDRLVRSLVDPDHPPVYIPIATGLVGQLPATLVTDLIHDQTLMRFLVGITSPENTFIAWATHPGFRPVALEGFALLQEFLISRRTKPAAELYAHPELDPIWPLVSQFLRTQSPTIRCALLASPQATSDDITIGLAALGRLGSNPFSTFPPCDFTQAKWAELAPRALLTALTHLYACENTQTFLPDRTPDTDLIDRATTTLALSDQKIDHARLYAFQQAHARHLSRLTSGMDPQTWLSSRLTTCLGLHPSPETIFLWTERLIGWTRADPATRRALGIALLEFARRWLQHPSLTQDVPPYTLTHALQRLRPDFLISAPTPDLNED